MSKGVTSRRGSGEGEFLIWDYGVQISTRVPGIQRGSWFYTVPTGTNVETTAVAVRVGPVQIIIPPDETRT